MQPELCCSTPGTFLCEIRKPEVVVTDSKPILLARCLSYLLIIYAMLVNVLSVPKCINSITDIIRGFCSQRGKGEGKELTTVASDDEPRRRSILTHQDLRGNSDSSHALSLHVQDTPLTLLTSLAKLCTAVFCL